MNDTTPPTSASEAIKARLLALGTSCLAGELTPFGVAKRAFDIGRIVGRAEQRAQPAREREADGHEKE